MSPAVLFRAAASLTRQRCWRDRAGLCFVALLLAACHSVIDETDIDTYVDWPASANGPAILDADGDRFVVRRVDRAVVSSSTGFTLTGLTVDTEATLRDRGAAIGSVASATATSGATVAVFKCSNGRGLNIIETGSIYTYVCV